LKKLVIEKCVCFEEISSFVAVKEIEAIRSVLHPRLWIACPCLLIVQFYLVSVAGEVD